MCVLERLLDAMMIAVDSRLLRVEVEVEKGNLR
jgi:hypothetical protein